MWGGDETSEEGQEDDGWGWGGSDDWGLGDLTTGLSNLSSQIDTGKLLADVGPSMSLLELLDASHAVAGLQVGGFHVRASS